MSKGRWQKFIDNQPKVMKAIIDNEGGRTKYWASQRQVGNQED